MLQTESKLFTDIKCNKIMKGKGVFMRFATLTLAVGILLAGSNLLCAHQPLPSFKAPLKKAENGKEFTGKMTLDREKLTFNYGSKRILFNSDGTFGVYSGVREVAKFVLVITTPRAKYQRNSVISTGLGTFMKMKNVSTTEDSILFEGTIPWNKATEPADLRSWKIAARIVEGKKLAVDIEYELPDYMKKQTDSGIFVQTGSQVVEFSSDKLGRWTPGQMSTIKPKGLATVNFGCNPPEDSFSLTGTPGNRGITVANPSGSVLPEQK